MVEYVLLLWGQTRAGGGSVLVAAEGGVEGHTAGTGHRLRLLRKREKSSEHMLLAWREEGMGQVRVG
jgi:hypothetical protein